MAARRKVTEAAARGGKKRSRSLEEALHPAQGEGLQHRSCKRGPSPSSVTHPGHDEANGDAPGGGRVPAPQLHGGFQRGDEGADVGMIR